MSSLQIAVAQPTITADPHVNGREVRRLMTAAAEAGARLVHFPEGMLSGYALEQVHDWSEVSWPTVRTELEAVAALAGELSLWVVLGSAHPLTPPHRPHNSLYVISGEGRLVDRYDKRRCSHTETSRFYTPGFEPVVVEVDGFRFGLALCIEVNFPELFSAYEQLGVDAVLLSAYPVDSVFEAKAQALAAVYNLWISVAAPAQATHLFCSGLFGPDGAQVVRADETPGMVTACLDRDSPLLEVALKMARPWRAVARAGKIYEERRVADPRSIARTTF